MTDTRKKDANWRLTVNPDGTVPNLDAHLAVLMDIRDELKQQNRHLDALEGLARCPNVQRGFISMRQIILHLEKFGAKAKPKK